MEASCIGGALRFQQSSRPAVQTEGELPHRAEPKVGDFFIKLFALCLN